MCYNVKKEGKGDIMCSEKDFCGRYDPKEEGYRDDLTDESECITGRFDEREFEEERGRLSREDELIRSITLESDK